MPEIFLYMKKPIPSYLIRFFVLTLFITITSAIYLILPSENLNSPNQINVATTSPPTEILPNFSTSTETIGPAKKIEKPTINTETTQSPAPLTATFKTPDATYNLQFYPGTNLLQAMRQLTAMSEQTFTFSGKEYPSLGFFIEEINGKKNDPTNDTYWLYYINGQLANIGISNYQIKQGDIIEWKYVKSKF